MKTYQGISFANVDINSGFWQHRQELNRKSTIYTVMQRFADPEAIAEYNEAYHMPVVKAKGWKRPAPEGEWLYRPLAGKLEQTVLTLIPYYVLANRGESDMRVWIPVRY